jgi:hypothetical protein
MGTTSINKLTATDAIALGDFFAIDDRSAGGDRKLPYSVLKAAIEALIAAGQTGKKSEYTKQFSTPVTGGTITITDGSNDDSNMWLIVTPAGTLANLAIKFPAVANLVDKQEILVNCTQDITALTFDKNGATDIIGEPTALTANDFFKFKYESQTLNWYRVG